MFLSFDANLIVRNVSDTPITVPDQQSRQADKDYLWDSLVGRRIPSTMIQPDDFKIRTTNELRVAVVCNWDDKCGISTYSGYLVNAMASKVGAIKVFSEYRTDPSPRSPTVIDVEECWTRGDSLLALAQKINDWSPDLVLIQHEFGIFPNAFRFMQFIQSLRHVPTAVCMHSVYRHLDKLLYAEAVPNIIVHTQQAKDTLREMGNTSNITVIPHGCVQPGETSELWNIMHSPYTVMQFGFGFRYKGVDRALRAIAHLIESDPKFKNLYYFYLCSSNAHNQFANQEYCDYLMNLADELGIRDNVAIVMKYQSDKMLNLYLRLAKLVVFPYLINDDNMVYGSSGAVRLAMAAKKPVIVSESHLFDDLEGVAPRPTDHIQLAKEIDEVFSNAKKRNELVDRTTRYIGANSWEFCVGQYLAVYNQIVGSR